MWKRVAAPSTRPTQQDELMTKTLPPTELLWDQFDFDPLNGFLVRKKTGHCDTPSAVYAHTTNGYRTFYVGRQFYEHRLVWKWVTGKDPEGHVDHRNRNRQCNQFWNLRILPDWLNRWTTTKPGYYWRNDRQQYMARVNDLAGKKLCFYTTDEDKARSWVLNKREEMIQRGLNRP